MLASLISFYYLCTCLAVDGWHWDASQERKSMAWPIIIRKTFALRFLLTLRNLGNFIERSVEDSGGRLPIVYIYTMA